MDRGGPGLHGVRGWRGPQACGCNPFTLDGNIAIIHGYDRRRPIRGIPSGRIIDLVGRCLYRLLTRNGNMCKSICKESHQLRSRQVAYSDSWLLESMIEGARRASGSESSVYSSKSFIEEARPGQHWRSSMIVVSRVSSATTAVLRTTRRCSVRMTMKRQGSMTMRQTSSGMSERHRVVGAGENRGKAPPRREGREPGKYSAQYRRGQRSG